MPAFRKYSENALDVQFILLIKEGPRKVLLLWVYQKLFQLQLETPENGKIPRTVVS